MFIVGGGMSIMPVSCKTVSKLQTKGDLELNKEVRGNGTKYRYGSDLLHYSISHHTSIFKFQINPSFETFP